MVAVVSGNVDNRQRQAEAEIAGAVAGPERQACWMQNGPLVPVWAAMPVPAGAIAVTPWDDSAGGPCGPVRLVTQRQFAASGVTFSHLDPLPCRFAAISYRVALGDGFALRTLLVRLLWCRFTGRDGYRSGGRVIRTLDEFDDVDVREMLVGE